MKDRLFYYTLNNNLLISNRYYDLERVSEEYTSNYKGYVYILNNVNSHKSRRSFYVTSESNLFIEDENLNLLKTSQQEELDFPYFILKAIDERKVISLNTTYENWKDCLNPIFPITDFKSVDFKKWNITVVGLGDVGGTLITGLRLLGLDCINQINIFDKDENKVKRWEYECNQILSCDTNINYPKIASVSEEDLFKADMFIFCVSVGVPKVGKEKSDVRLIQFQGNSKIVKYYAEKAKSEKFKGIFAVISDPVDLLCKTVLKAGLIPEQIRGYGLGVMNARACYYASKQENSIQYLKEGRVFGPHGEDLIVADSIENYNEKISKYLTQKTVKANLDIRALGFKPYIAPAMSSGALSILDTIKGQWHYSASFIGGAFMGWKNRLLPYGTELETYDNIPDILFNKIQKVYNKLLLFNE